MRSSTPSNWAAWLYQPLTPAVGQALPLQTAWLSCPEASSNWVAPAASSICKASAGSYETPAGKASLSTNARLAVQIGMARRVSLPGDRRDYYEMTPGSFENMVAHRLQAIDAFIHLSEEGLEAVDRDNTTARTRLETMRDFYKFFLDELAVALDHWRNRR